MRQRLIGRTGRAMFALRPLALAVCLGLSSLATAGVFDDEEARRQIKDLNIKTNERLDILSKAQFELVNQIQALRDENAKLRGQVETLNYELESAKKRQQDFYVDLDGRLRKLEPQVPTTGASGASDSKSSSGAAANAGGTARKSTSDPAAETREYEAALNLLKTNKLKEAAAAFEDFVQARPDSTLTPNAQYWLGNSYYALRECKKAIEAHKVVVSRWPQNAKAPDALLNIATCQQELGDSNAAKSSLNAVLIKYPDSPAASTAKQRLKK